MRKRRVVMERLAPLGKADRAFDLEFWRRVGSAKKFEAAWQMVLDFWKWQGKREDQLRLRRDVERLEPMRRPLSRCRRPRRDALQRNKRAVGRKQDLLDLESLASVRGRRPRAPRQ